MSRTPFDPMKSAAMQAAKARKSAANPDTPPLAPHQERTLIEALAEAEAHELMTLPAGTATKPLTVGQINALLNEVLLNTLPPVFFIAGEISNFRTYDRGHAFFTLKEAGAELPCVLWKDSLARLKFKPRDGLAVIARGSVKLYEPQGKIQLYVETLFPQGAGVLELAFRQLCDKLKAEGLFDPARKRPLPKFPQRIAIITSKTGDVLHDVLTTAYRRFPGLHTMLFPVRVQGDQAAQEIANAIKALNTHNKKLETRNSKLETIDLILLVRGGGSLEDLWAFNEEIVARAIAASKIPIATGIGHEPDTTIADLVGDLRGPTPTGITELTIPDVRTLLADLHAKATLLTRDIHRLAESSRNRLDRPHLRLTTALRETLRLRSQRLDLLRRQVERIEPRHAIAQGWRRVEESRRDLNDALSTRLRHERDTLTRLQHRLEKSSPLVALRRHRDRLTALENHLRAVSPQSILDRGFSITTTSEGNIIRSTTQVKKGDIITTRVADGTIDSTVGKPKQSTLF